MMTRYAVYLDKKGLADIDPAIYILDVSYAAPTITTTAYNIPGRDGQRITNRRADMASVQVSFEIHEQDTDRREDVCRRVQEWAMKGGILTSKNKPGKRLRVVCTDPPSLPSELRWTQALKMTFAAYDPPYWEDEYPRSATVSGTSGKASLYVGGMGALARVTATVKNQSSGTLNALTLKAGGTTMEFTSLGLAAGATLTIDYGEDMLLRIRAGNTSKMDKRTAASSDDLMIPTGQASEVSVSAGASASVMFKARGLYL